MTVKSNTFTDESRAKIAESVIKKLGVGVVKLVPATYKRKNCMVSWSLSERQFITLINKLDEAINKGTISR
jgi:hypothetical protein